MTWRRGREDVPPYELPRGRHTYRHKPNPSQLRLGRAGMVTDGGAPHCRECGQPLQFDADRQGRTTESCGCGYHGYLKTRPYDVTGATPLAPGYAPRVSWATAARIGQRGVCE